jgi:hypothetical protein
MFDRVHLSWLRGAAVAAFGVVALATPAAAQTGGGSTQSSGKITDNLNVFMGLEGSKQPQDLGINANMGARLGVNLGFPISKGRNIGAQAGIAFNLSDAAVHVLDQVTDVSKRTQTFVTAGVFQRGEKIRWAAGFDIQFADYYDTFTVAQFRGQVGTPLRERHEVGAWFTVGTSGADVEIADTGIAVRLDPIDQYNGYWSYLWPSGGRTFLWGGMAAGHDNIVLTISEEPRSDWVFVYGAALQVPLSDKFGIAGAANFLTPTATGTVDAFLGVVWSPGGGMMKGGGTFRPMMPVGNNPMMPINMKFPSSPGLQ